MKIAINGAGIAGCALAWWLRRSGHEAARRFAPSFAPRTGFGVVVRNQASRLLGIPFVANALLARAVRDDIELPAYAFTASCSCSRSFATRLDRDHERQGDRAREVIIALAGSNRARSWQGADSH